MREVYIRFLYNRIVFLRHRLPITGSNFCTRGGRASFGHVLAGRTHVAMFGLLGVQLLRRECFGPQAQLLLSGIPVS